MIVLTFGLGIGASVATFSILAGVILEDLPFEEADRIMAIQAVDRRTGKPAEIPLGLLLRWRESAGSFEGLAGYSESFAFVTLGESGTTGYPAAFVTPDFFRLIGARPARGGAFRGTDRASQTSRVGVLAHGAWRQDFDSDPQVIGEAVRVNQELTTITGIMPDGFDFPSGQKIWVAMRTEGAEASTSSFPVHPIGRLAEGSSTDVAEAELVGLAKQYGPGESADFGQLSFRVEPFVLANTDPRLKSAVGPMILAMLAIVALMCANVTNLLLAKAESERHRTGVRIALGADRARIVSESVFETSTFASLGGIVGLGLGWFLVQGFNHLMSPSQFFLASWVEIDIDPKVLFFLLVVTWGAGLLASVLPVLRSTKIPPTNALRGGVPQGIFGRFAHSNRALIIVEVALAAALLFLAGVLVRNVLQLRSADVGIEAENVVTAKVSIHQARDLGEKETLRFFQEFARQLEARPGVEVAAYSTLLPTQGSFHRELLVPQQVEPVEVRWQVVTPGVFDALGVPVLRGEAFEGATGSTGPPKAIVNRSFAERYLDENPMGARLELPGSEDPDAGLSVIGVVEDYEMARLGEETSGPALFTPLAQDVRSSMVLVARTPEGVSLPIADLCREAGAVHPEAACFDSRALTEVLSERLWIYDAVAALFASLGALALILGGAGLFGILSFQVSRRSREVGLRFALGADRRCIQRLVLRQFSLPALVGLVLGLVGGIGSARLVATLLYGVESWDPLVFSSTVVILVGSALLAVYGPARRASGVDPASFLRQD